MGGKLRASERARVARGWQVGLLAPRRMRTGGGQGWESSLQQGEKIYKRPATRGPQEEQGPRVDTTWVGQPLGRARRAAQLTAPRGLVEGLARRGGASADAPRWLATRARRHARRLAQRFPFPQQTGAFTARKSG